MDYDAARFWLELILILINLLLGIYVWRSNKDRVTKRQLDEHTVMLATFEVRLKNAVGHTDLHPIYDKINTISEELSKMNGQMHTLDLIHQMLLNGASK